MRCVSLTVLAVLAAADGCSEKKSAACEADTQCSWCNFNLGGVSFSAGCFAKEDMWKIVNPGYQCNGGLASYALLNSVLENTFEGLTSSPRGLEEISAPSGIVGGWNTSVGNEKERNAAAEHFGVKVSDDASLWTNNDMIPFIGKTLQITKIDIKTRNPFNTIIEQAVNHAKVMWTVQPGVAGFGAWEEAINGGYTGRALAAGFVSRSKWIENDNKKIGPFTLANDWGVMDVVNVTKDGFVIDYQSYKKGVFTMTLTFPSEQFLIV